MINRVIITTLITGGAAIIGSSSSMAETIGMEYTTEWQTNFSGGYDWLNLLNITAEVPVYGGLSLEASTLSTAKTGDDALVADRLTYSNIEAGNIPLTFARLGLNLTIRQAELFVGINNVNEDYFTSELTSFFTNSSCGISPTLSCNYDIANYPLASWCIHYRQQLGYVSFQTSLYPGKGYSRILGHDNLFSLDIKRDGIFSISSIDYQRNGNYCVLGIALYHGVCMGDEKWAQEATPSEATQPQKKSTAAPWLLSEISLPNNFGVHSHVAYSSVKHGCKVYTGIGMLHNGERVQPGVAVNYASFSDGSEYTAELTCRVPLVSDKVYMQPTLHLVKTDHGRVECVGMLRMVFNP